MSLVKTYKSMNPLGRRFLKLAMGILLGGAAGYAYYALIGCSSGGCPITSNPVVSTGYGSLIGALFVGWK